MWNVIGVWVAAGLTLCIFSFLYRDNPFYKFAEHLYVGFSAGYWVIQIWFYTIQPMLLEPIMKKQEYILIIPGILGVLMLTRWFPKIAWISRWPISFTVGISAGLAITGSLQGWLLPQLSSTVLPLTKINNVLLVLGVLTTIFYFYFSIEHKGVVGGAAKIGIVFIMISFGASFGYTVMARISLFIGRMIFLLHDWLHIIKI